MKHTAWLTALALTLPGPVVAESKSGKAKPANCKVELVSQANAGSSILISFSAGDQQECERAAASDIKTTYTPDKKKTPPGKR